MKCVAAVLLLLCACAVAQESAPKGSHELAVWLSGGRGTTGRFSDTGVLLAALRYGWVLSAPHGPGPLRGTFEYAVDAVPMFLVFQRNNAYGAGINPVVLKWNFDRAPRVLPYIEINGGTLFTSQEVPPGTSSVNFTSGAAFGVQFTGHHWNPLLAVRYMHISNAGLTEPNPGVNTVQLTLGLNRFSSRR
jgi:hypothetical protein